MSIRVFYFFVWFLVYRSRDDSVAGLSNLFISEELHKAVSCKRVALLVGWKFLTCFGIFCLSQRCL